MMILSEGAFIIHSLIWSSSPLNLVLGGISDVPASKSINHGIGGWIGMTPKLSIPFGLSFFFEFFSDFLSTFLSVWPLADFSDFEFGDFVFFFVAFSCAGVFKDVTSNMAPHDGHSGSFD